MAYWVSSLLCFNPMYYIFKGNVLYHKSSNYPPGDSFIFNGFWIWCIRGGLIQLSDISSPFLQYVKRGVKTQASVASTSVVGGLFDGGILTI